MSLIVNVFVYLTIILKLFFAVFNGFIIAFIVAFLTNSMYKTFGWLSLTEEHRERIEVTV